jgi:hypothetical protein
VAVCSASDEEKFSQKRHWSRDARLIGFSAEHEIKLAATFVAIERPFTIVPALPLRKRPG